MPSAIRQLRHPQRLVVDAGGFRFETQQRGQWVAANSVGWSDVVEFFGHRLRLRWPLRGTLLCCYRMTPAAAAARPVPKGRFGRWVQSTNANLVGGRVSILPTTIGKPQELLEFLIAAHQQQRSRDF